MVKQRMDLLELLRKRGMDGDVDLLREALRVLVDGIMDAEVSAQIGAQHGERSPERVTYRNGYRNRTWDTRVGTMELHIPKLREGSYFPSCPASTIFAGWRQSVLPVHLLGLAPLLGSVGPVAGDVKLQDDGVVHDPVNRRGGGHGVGKDALPLREDQV